MKSCKNIALHEAPRVWTQCLEWDYLNTVYELGGKTATNDVSFRGVMDELGLSEEDAGCVCDFWVRRGALRWSGLGYVALTRGGVRGAEPAATASAVS
jgi:hypothetical protein